MTLPAWTIVFVLVIYPGLPMGLALLDIWLERRPS